MIRNNGLKGLASQAFDAAAEQLQNVVEEASKTTFSKALVRTAQLAGLPDSKLVRTARTMLRAPSNPPLGTAQKSAAAPALPQEILENIADHLDRPTLTNFARSSYRFADIAGGAVHDLSFNTPGGLREGMAYLSDESRSRFAQRGLHALTLKGGPYDAEDLEALPEWIRTSIHSIVLDCPLTDDGWRFLSKCPKLREVGLRHPEDYVPLDLAKLPKSLDTLLLNAPFSPDMLKELSTFPSLKKVGVVLDSDASLTEVLKHFDPAANSADITAHGKHPGDVGPLHNVELTALTYYQNRTFDEADIAQLPSTLQALKLPWRCRLSANAFKELERVKLRSLDISQARNLSGELVKALVQHPTLRQFRSAASNLTTDDARVIAASPRLTKVELPYNNEIGDAGIHALLDNKRIEVLDISRCGSRPLMQDLHKKMPPHLRQLVADT